MTAVLRQTLRTDANHTIHLVLPAEMGDQVEVIVFPARSQKNTPLSQDEAFLLAAYSAVTEDSAEEDTVWEKYVRK